MPACTHSRALTHGTDAAANSKAKDYKLQSNYLLFTVMQTCKSMKFPLKTGALLLRDWWELCFSWLPGCGSKANMDKWPITLDYWSSCYRPLLGTCHSINLWKQWRSPSKQKLLRNKEHDKAPTSQTETHPKPLGWISPSASRQNHEIKDLLSYRRKVIQESWITDLWKCHLFTENLWKLYM